jgi:hypothetical protein
VLGPGDVGAGDVVLGGGDVVLGAGDVVLGPGDGLADPGDECATDTVMIVAIMVARPPVSQKNRYGCLFLGWCWFGSVVTASTYLRLRGETVQWDQAPAISDSSKPSGHTHGTRRWVSLMAFAPIRAVDVAPKIGQTIGRCPGDSRRAEQNSVSTGGT